MTARARRTATIPNGILMKKIHYQERKWVRRAPSLNPAARPRPLAEERYPRALPLRSSGYHSRESVPRAYLAFKTISSESRGPSITGGEERRCWSGICWRPMVFIDCNIYL
ncbi:hypothetical protein [Methanosphaerula palustris]|uniref:hypothetical protein n=1 Tax=Methanosphaerula palustris TaxID=475088 RepID=UPI0011D0EFCC|nr:hypothetical protein [Methanosphaerula palustris]